MRFQLTNTLLHRLFFVTVIILLAASFAGNSGVALGQNPTLEQKRKKADELYAAHKLTDALPLLEELAEAMPDDEKLQTQLGFALLAQTAHSEKPEDRAALRIRARKAFVNARRLGDDSPTVKALIDSIAIDGTEDANYSANPAADALMRQAEMYFASGKMKEALEAYQETLVFDPKNYYAALFSGDVYTHTNKYDDAEKWYKKAMEINPEIETAYRYSATPLMRQRKFAEARDRYIEAFIVEPYNRLAISGILQWGRATNTQLTHPALDLPAFEIGEDGKVNSKINVNLQDESSFVWIGYISVRTTWYETKFKAEYPAEKKYRHTLREEAEALRSVITLANEQKKKGKKLSSQLQTLLKLDEEGVLEAFILMAKPDDGIAVDHKEYMRANRDKLRKYVIRFVIGAEK